jgi:hypothetical protein
MIQIIFFLLLPALWWIRALSLQIGWMFPLRSNSWTCGPNELTPFVDSSYRHKLWQNFRSHTFLTEVIFRHQSILWPVQWLWEGCQVATAWGRGCRSYLCSILMWHFNWLYRWYTSQGNKKNVSCVVKLGIWLLNAEAVARLIVLWSYLLFIKSNTRYSELYHCLI